MKYTRFPSLSNGSARLSLTNPAARSLGRFSDHTEKTTTPKAATSARERPSPILALFLTSFFVPVVWNVATFSFSLSRLFLVFAALPTFIAWLSGKAGRLQATDVMVVLTALWAALTLQIGVGPSSPEYAVITAIEFLTPFLLGRVLVRNEGQYRATVRALGWAALVLLPVAALEALTGFRVFNFVFGLPQPSVAIDDMRLGMVRAQTVFVHPILSGIALAMCFAPIYFAVRPFRGAITAGLASAPVVGVVFFSLSSGAWVVLMTQMMFMAWGRLCREISARWYILAAIAFGTFVVLEVLSNRSLLKVAAQYLALNPWNGYVRVVILENGLNNVWAHPVFGLALADWARPAWLPSSVDNFWLVMAMRHGIPGFLLMAGSWLSALIYLILSQPETKSTRMSRDAHAFVLISVAVAIFTVHLWGTALYLAMFMLGASGWFFDPADEPTRERAREAADEAGASERQARRS